MSVQVVKWKDMKINIILGRPTGFYIPRFRNFGDDKRDYLVDLVTRVVPVAGWGREVAELNIGADFKDALSEPGGWRIGATAFGEMLPYHENKITLDKNKKDKWGSAGLEYGCRDKRE